jgi:DNA-binding CsgD family transcriptional regulator
MMAEDAGDYATAEQLLTTAQRKFEQTGERWRQLVTGYHLGIVALGQENYPRATALLEAALAAAHDLGDVLLPSWCLHRLALIAYDQSDSLGIAGLLDRSRQLYGTASTLRHQWWDQLTMATALATVLGESEVAGWMLGDTAAGNYDLALPLPEGAYYARMVETTRKRLGNEAYLAAWSTGRQMPRAELAAAMDRLLTAAGQSPVISPMSHDPTRLTPREREVLLLLVEGRTNREIAERLYIGHRTATTHVTNILAKFGVETRAAAVTYAFQHDLV